jgi:hypothetical protein
MKIDRKLNLVWPIELDDGTKLYVHAVPLSMETWETYFLVLSRTYAEIMGQGLTVLAGPPIARMLLRQVAMALRLWDGDQGVKDGLLPEMRRLTTVIMAHEGAWKPLPYDTAVAQGLLSEEAMEEAEGQIVFFMCVSAVLRGPGAKAQRTVMLNGIAQVWRAQFTLSNSMEFLASLPTSTPDASSGEKKAALSHVR